MQDSYLNSFKFSLIFTDTSPYHILILLCWPTFNLSIQNLANSAICRKFHFYYWIPWFWLRFQHRRNHKALLHNVSAISFFFFSRSRIEFGPRNSDTWWIVSSLTVIRKVPFIGLVVLSVVAVRGRSRRMVARRIGFGSRLVTCRVPARSRRFRSEVFFLGRIIFLLLLFL